MTYSFPFRRARLLCLPLIVIGLWSCQKTAPVLTMDTKPEIQVSADGSGTAITFTANGDWEISVAESWVHIDRSSGSGSDSPISIRVTCDPNTTYDDRTSTVTIVSGDLRQTVTITQPAKSGLLVEGPSDFSLARDAQSLEIEVKANVDYEVDISADWIRRADTKALTSNTLRFSIEENATFEERSATIRISGAGLSQSITVKQDAAPNPAAGKVIQSVRVESDFPEMDFSSLQILFTYDDDKRLVKATIGVESGNSVDFSYQYSGKSMMISEFEGTPLEIYLDDSGRFSSVTDHRKSFMIGYDSEGRLLSVLNGEKGYKYQWQGNELYSFEYAGSSEDYSEGFHFEPSGFLAPEKGVDINMVTRLLVSWTELDELLEMEREVVIVLLPGMIGKRSEHALSLILDDHVLFEGRYPLYSLVEYGAEYQGTDGNWHPLDRNTINTWSEGFGSFAFRCSRIPKKCRTAPWEWTSEDGVLPTGARCPIVTSMVSLSGTLVAYGYDYDYDGVVSLDEVDFTTQDVSVTPLDTTIEYSLDFSFEYE